MDPEAAPEEIANGKQRRLLAYNRSANCADVKVGSSAVFFKAANLKSAPRSRGRDVSPDTDGAGATMKFQSQTFKVARQNARREVDTEDARGVDGDPASECSDALNGMPSVALGKTPGDDRLFAEREGDSIKTGTASRRSDGHEFTGAPSPSPAAVPVPALSSFPV